MKTSGWCHNGYQSMAAGEVARRARVARLDALIIKYGDPSFERAIAAEGLAWGVERFAYASQAAQEGAMLADAVDAGARFAVANCEPNDGGGWDAVGAAAAMRSLIDAFRRRHSETPLFVCADLRRGRSLDAPFIREAARGGIAGWMPMVYPGAFQQSPAAAFDAAYPGATYFALPCEPVVQTYGGIGAAVVLQQIIEAKRRGAAALSMYNVESATAAELEAMSWAKTGAPADAATLRSAQLDYMRGAIAILDHGTPSELSAWGEYFARSS